MRLQEKLKLEQLARLKSEEDAKVRLSDCTKHYESQIRTMRINHEQVIFCMLFVVSFRSRFSCSLSSVVTRKIGTHRAEMMI